MVCLAQSIGRWVSEKAAAGLSRAFLSAGRACPITCFVVQRPEKPHRHIRQRTFELFFPLRCEFA